LRSGTRIADGLAQRRYGHVNRIVRGRLQMSPYRFDQYIPADHRIRVLDDVLEQGMQTRRERIA